MTPLLELEGTAEEIQLRLADFNGQRLRVIVLPSASAEKNYPDNAVFRNGVPLFPVNGRTEIITAERVQRLIHKAV